jgi:hypothetical protein
MMIRPLDEIVADIESYNTAWYCGTDRSEVLVMIEELRALREALEFYANPDNHLQKFGQPFTAIPVWQDAGSRAREALEFTK